MHGASACTCPLKGVGEYITVADAFASRGRASGGLSPLHAQRQSVGLQQTQAGNVPTVVRHAIHVLSLNYPVYEVE